MWLSRSDPISPTCHLYRIQLRQTGGEQESLPCSSCCTCESLQCSWVSICCLLPILAWQCVVLLHLQLLGGSSSGGSFSPVQYLQPPLASRTLEQPPSPPQERDILSIREADVQTRARCSCRDRFTAQCFTSSGAENVRFVPVGWRSCCPLLAGASGFERSLKHHFRGAWILGNFFSFDTCLLGCFSSSSNSS